MLCFGNFPEHEMSTNPGKVRAGAKGVQPLIEPLGRIAIFDVAQVVVHAGIGESLRGSRRQSGRALFQFPYGASDVTQLEHVIEAAFENRDTVSTATKGEITRLVRLEVRPPAPRTALRSP